MTAFAAGDNWEVHCADCLGAMADLPDSSVNLIATDPPYFRVKNLPWDRQWGKPEEFIAWIGRLCEQWQRVLAPNGSLYVFASPRMAARVECEVGRWFEVLNRIVWRKGFAWCKRGNDGKPARCSEGTLRHYYDASETIIFAEHFGADNRAKGEAGYVAACDELRGFVFEPLRAYLDGERRKAGINFEQVREAVGCAAGSGLPSHWFTQSQWALPTEPNYMRLRDLFNSRGNGGEFLAREYEDLRAEYEDLRRPFSVTADVPYTDVWDFPTVKPYPGKHPCEKPLAMMEHIVTASSREGDTVLDCFAGSGVTGEAAIRNGRKFIGIEMAQEWCEAAARRLDEVENPAQFQLTGM